MASGYLKVEEIEYRGLTLEPWYSSFHHKSGDCEHVFEYVQKAGLQRHLPIIMNLSKALLNGDVKAMNLYMNDIALATFSNFDAGKTCVRAEPARAVLSWICTWAAGGSARSL